tara:strand:- start:2046 stop:3059 length:1014 start_codon:yes stop_codon:yes gene_type:complete
MMDVSALQAVLERGEDSRHQFKADFTNANSLAPELAALANGAGGRLFIGVTDDGHIAGLSRQDVGRLNQRISNAASQHGRPPLNPTSHNVQTETGLVIVVEVTEGMNKPYVGLPGRIWVKNGADKRHVTAREEMRRLFVFSDRVEIISLGHLPDALTSEQIRAGRSNRRNKVLAGHAAHILPYRGMGTGIPPCFARLAQDRLDRRERRQPVSGCGIAAAGGGCGRSDKYRASTLQEPHKYLASHPSSAYFADEGIRGDVAAGADGKGWAQGSQALCRSLSPASIRYWRARTIPDKPQSSKQRYRLTDKGRELLANHRGINSMTDAYKCSSSVRGDKH